MDFEFSRLNSIAIFYIMLFTTWQSSINLSMLSYISKAKLAQSCLNEPIGILKISKIDKKYCKLCCQRSLINVFH
jgi:hypothetical protein